MDNHATIIIKKVKKGGHGGHHGGAWKVAYADFVTAMMAFFLLLWLLNATTEEQKMGISNYFDPTAISRSTRSGSGGVLGGTSITVPGALKSASSPPMISTPQVARPQAERTESLDADSDDPENIESRLGSDDDAEGLISAEKLEKLLEEREAAQFASAENMLRKAIDDSKDPELKEIADSLQIDQSPEGLRIQLLDQEKVALFPLGSADMLEQTRKLLEKVSEIIAKLPNKIKISGHTDSRPFPEGATYTNWELSADRALSSRRALIANGIPSERVAQVVGMADTDPIEPNDPTSPSNRRISIVLLRQDFSDQAAEAVAASGEPSVQPLETTLPPVVIPDNGSALPPCGPEDSLSGMFDNLRARPLAFFHTLPMPCPYLPGKTERRLIADISSRRGQLAHDTLAKAGFRRTQHLTYRPACPGCNACNPVRVRCGDFRWSRTFRKLLKRNADLNGRPVQAIATREQYRLFHAYQQGRHGDGEMAMMDFADYAEMVERSPIETYLIEYRDAAHALVAIMLVDEQEDGLSAVYSFFDTTDTTRGFGTYMVLDLIERTKAHGLEYLYLGYWIPDCRKMAYKTKYRPYELLTLDGWVEADADLKTLSTD